jgi:hemolysin III
MIAVFPRYTPRERLADACIHILGTTGSAVGLTIIFAMSVATLPAAHTLSLMVYGIGV